MWTSFFSLNLSSYCNFKGDNGLKGGHYFHPGGRWSILSDDGNQLPCTNNAVNATLDPQAFFIDDEYSDQEELSFNEESPLEFPYFPSVASFPDEGLDERCIHPSRERFISVSEPDLTAQQAQSCSKSISKKFRQWRSAVRDVWASHDNIALESVVLCHSPSRKREGEGRRRAATPQ